MAETIGPAYQRVADDLKRQIGSGELSVGEAIPSAQKLMQQYAVSSTVVRNAISQLRSEGIVVGHPGKAVYVKTTPAAAEEERNTVEALSREIDDLKAEVGRLTGKITRLQVHLKDLCARLGQPYPEDDASAEPTRPRHRNTGS